MTDTDDIKVDVDDLKNDSFMNHLNSTLLVKRNFELHEYDYEWLERIEDVLPYLDNILRNPKRFIVNEEEIVKVELSKKITVESVIHLTQHTNLIQDYNEKTGDVKPTKVLNINKEESLDTYENRFIYTLINNRKGENLSTSEVKMFSNGGVKCGLSKYEKRDVSMLTPKWNIEKCIECGVCRSVCPVEAPEPQE